MTENSTIIDYFSAFQKNGTPKVSFEFFPPKTDKAAENLWETIKTLEPLNPEYISVTYGAGGSTQQKTLETVLRVKNETKLKPVAHLTCVGASKAQIRELAETYLEAGITDILALRGDPPANEPNFQVHPDGYEYASDLVKGLLEIGDFNVSVAAFPEKHPEAESLESDIENLKRKQDAGATSAITQYFFDPEVHLAFVEKARAAGITIPIIPGILLMNGVEQTIRFSNMCGAIVPDWTLALIEGLDDAPEQRELMSAIIAAEQCRILCDAGVNEFHFYTLNRPHAATVMCRLMGMKPTA